MKRNSHDKDARLYLILRHEYKIITATVGMIFFSRGKIAIQSHYLAVVMSSAAANVVCVSLIFIQQTAMRQNLKLSFVFDLFFKFDL